MLWAVNQYSACHNPPETSEVELLDWPMRHPLGCF
jgi:hypothetical protein